MSKGKRFSPEFRAEAVRLYRMSGQSIASVAHELNISTQSVARWARQAKIDEGKAAGLTSEEREEFRHLQRENKLLREEKEILRKVALFFARETDQRR